MADEGISAGVVHVSVVPRSTGFWQKFAADNAGGAAKAGDDLGDRIGKAIAARVGKSIRDGLDGAGTGVGAQGAKFGGQFGGTFADTAKKRIEAALKSLPTPQIGVATTEAEQKLKDLRSELSTLSGKKIGVDIGATEALDEVRRLKTALGELGSKSPNVQVRVDAANAAIELATIDREVSRLDGRRADVNVNTNAVEAAGGLQTLLNAGIALGPAIIPAAAAGAAAILGIGISALSAAPAVGVLALAFRGIGGAVSALDAAQQASAKTGSTVVQQQKSLSSSADQVRSAEASLANTRANAADSQRRSLQQIADAERAVGQAQKDATRAQADLNTARDEEARSQQDTAFQLRQNAIDQKKAALEVAAAQKAAAFGGDGSQAALEEALLRQEELRAAGQRLADEQQRNTATGIDGSKRVVAAQGAVVKAQEKIADAERGVADARAQAASQARQSAFAIAQAQQAVATAARSAGAATVAAAAAGGAAVDKLNDALNDLPVSGQAFARFIFGLKPELRDLQEAAANGLLPGVQDGIQILLPYVGNLRSTVADVSGELGILARRGAETFTSPFWRQFFGYIGSQAVPTLDNLFQATTNVAEGGARILQQFAPFERQVGGGLVSVTQKFLAFSQGLDHNQGFQQFIRYALTEGPRVVATIGELAKAGLHIVEAYAPVGSVVVTELRLLGTVINAIPVPVLTALVAAITAYKTAALLSGIAQNVLNSGIVQGIAGMITYRTVTDAAGVATTGMQRAVGATSSFMGGPFTLALAAAGLAIGYFIAENQKAKAETDALRTSLSNFADTFKDGVTPAAEESAKSILAHDAALRGLVTTTRQMGIDTATLVSGLNGDKAARDQVVAALDAQIASAKQASAMYASLGAGQQHSAQAASEQAEKLTALRNAFVTTNDANAEAGDLTRALTEDQKRANGIFGDASPVVKTLADSYRIVADATSTAAEKTNALKDAEDALFGAARNADEAAEAQAKAIRASNKTLDDRALLGEKGAKSLDLNTEAGTRLRDSLKDELTAINATFRANVANGMSVEEATKQHDIEVEALKRKSAQKGVDQAATQKLIDIYGKVPPSASTDVTVTGIGATRTQLDELLAYQLALRTGISLDEARAKISPPVKTAPGKGNSGAPNLATGGPVVGPGTGTSDDVPAIEQTTGARFNLSNGEFVQRTAAVQHYGPGFMHAVNDLKFPKQIARGYASGGLINQILNEHYPFPTTTAKTRIPSKAEVAAAVTEGPTTGGSEAIKAFIRSVDPLPYIWANAGPGGYDCSGLSSAVYGLVTGKGGGHGQRYFTTHDFANGAPAGFKPGAGGVLTVGVNPATHMAGNYGGLGFEAASTRSGIKIGNSAKKPSTFQKQFHLAGGGLISAAALEELGLDIGGDQSGLTVDGKRVPLGVFDSGGYLPTGLSLAYNGTGRPEVIPPPSQSGGDPNFNVVLSVADPQLRALVSMIDVRVERGTAKIARDIGNGVRT